MAISRPAPGDLVTLYNIGHSSSLIVWKTWNDDDQPLLSWPEIVGKFYKNESAVVLEVYDSIKTSFGAKICTERNIIGWVSAKNLYVIKTYTTI